MSNPIFYADTSIIRKFAECRKFEELGLNVIDELKLSSGSEAAAIYEIYNAVIEGRVIPCILPQVYEELAFESKKFKGTYKYPVCMQIIKEFCCIPVPIVEKQNDYYKLVADLYKEYKDNKLFYSSKDNKDCRIMAEVVASGLCNIVMLKNMDIEHFLTLEEQINRNASNIVLDAVKQLNGGKIVTTNIDDFLRPKIQRKGKKQQDAKTVINEINKKFTQKELVPYIASEYIETSEFKEAIKDKEEKVVTNEDVKEETINILKLETNDIVKNCGSEQSDDGM